MSELSFLIELLLNDLVPKEIKIIISNRIKEVEVKYNQPAINVPPAKPIQYNPVTSIQSPSTQTALERQQASVDVIPTSPIIASPAAVQALEARRQAMQEAFNGPKPGQTSPTKFHGTK